MRKSLCFGRQKSNACEIVRSRCSCETLVGAREYRCCKETPARGKMLFDGSIERINCITEHEDYAALTNRTVLSLVGPLLRCRNGRSYRRSAGQSENE